MFPAAVVKAVPYPRPPTDTMNESGVEVGYVADAHTRKPTNTMLNWTLIKVLAALGLKITVGPTTVSVPLVW